MQLKELYRLGKENLSRHSIEAPALEAYILLSKSEVIKDLSEVYTYPEKEIDRDGFNKFQKLLERRIKREPAAYIRGEKEFYSRSFKVNASVLIPRPETELLVDETLDIARQTPSPLILEIGTGSGCIAVTLACEHENVRIVASDVSKEALSVAKENTKRYEQNQRISLIRGDLLSSFKNEIFDIIASNPPYISEAEFVTLEPDVKQFEPRASLVAGEDGLYYIREIISGSKRTLKEGGWCVLEIGHAQRERVECLFNEYGFTEISSAKDLNGTHRVVKAKWKK